MGSGHILVYAFDVLMQIYESYGYSQRDAAKSIIENNLYGLDIDNRAYQLAYFAVMMKARQYNRRILNGETICHVFAIQESNAINRDQLKYFGFGLSDMEKNTSLLQIRELLDSYEDAKEYGSIIAVENCNWELLRKFIKSVDLNGQLSLDALGIDIAADLLALIINLGETMARKYDVVVSNPPYMGIGQ
jgi:type I restriction-modification system DNA methylase subunit